MEITIWSSPWNSFMRGRDLLKDHCGVKHRTVLGVPQEKDNNCTELGINVSKIHIREQLTTIKFIITIMTICNSIAHIQSLDAVSILTLRD